MPFTAMDWNLAGANADTDRDAFNTMTANLWTPEQISLADDAEDIRGLDGRVRSALNQVLAGLSTVETMQATIGASTLSSDALLATIYGPDSTLSAAPSHNDNSAEPSTDSSTLSQAPLTAVSFGESIHTKVYSQLIAALANDKPHDESSNPPSATTQTATMVEHNEALQTMLETLAEAYRPADPEPDDESGNPASNDTSNSSNDTSASTNSPFLASLKHLAAAVLAEALLVESGFYLPMWLSSRATLAKSADVIRLINRDIVTSSSYLGSVYQRKLEQLDDDSTRETMRQYVYDLANNLYFAEEDYSYTLPHADLGLDDDIEKFLSYNVNKALSYLGYPALFPAEISQPNPAIIDELNDMESVTSALKSGSLFAGSSTNAGSVTNGVPSSALPSSSTGATVANKAEETSDDDWDF